MDTLFEFRKGVLFVRIKGVITHETEDNYNEVISMIKDNGIRKVVINLKKVYKIDLKGINILFYTYEIIKNNKGELIFSNINDNIIQRIKKSHINKYVKIIDEEIDIFKEEIYE